MSTHPIKIIIEPARNGFIIRASLVDNGTDPFRCREVFFIAKTTKDIEMVMTLIARHSFYDEIIPEEEDYKIGAKPTP